MHSEVKGTALPSVMALAYLGDARHSLHVRRMLVESGIVKPKELNLHALNFVTAEAQARAFSRIEHLLLDDERDVFRRAANSTHLNRPKHASGKDYRTATGFEAVIGMLEWLGDYERLELLLKEAQPDLNKPWVNKEDNDNDTEN